ncbi:MAG TPA: DUF1553 domain-containing protein [Bryobacteraceae bacterium]|nr:DUF1553 domain-containing protein [Bryobacteraceae bacterium]
MSRWLPTILLAFSYSAYGAEQPVQFNRDIRPIMSDTCFRCHGPDAKARMANMRLDIRDEALKPNKKGLAPIVPGDPEKSHIIQRVFAADAKVMPPKYAHKELTEKQKELLKRWVAEGAVYQGHWAYEPVKRPAVPAVAGGTIRNPIDNFIQERLLRDGLKPSAEADKRTLLRRVTLDLTGLPPTPAELDAFLKDKSPNAYEAVVDRLLASPRYAEMQAVRWLDAVRYADSAGFHGDNLWPAWPYRDYVLKSFRDNKPFDVFTREQIAGDLLPNATLEQKIASAYNRLNRASAEGGLQPKEYLAKYGADRVRTTTTVWLGATMGCAECHDHKFDPFTAKDFYSFKAFFSDIKETGLVPDRGVKAWGSKLALPSAEQKAKLDAFDSQIEALKTELTTKTRALEEKRWRWETDTLAAYRAGKLAWRYQVPVEASTANGAKLTVTGDEPVDSNFYLNGSLVSDRGTARGLVMASGPNPDREVYTVKVKPGEGTWRSVGLDIWQDESLPGNRMSRGADRFVLSELEVEIADDGKALRKLKLQTATTNEFGEWPENAAPMAIDGDLRTGWGVGFGESRNAFLAVRLAEPVTTGAGSVLTLRLRQESPYRRATIGRFRVALSEANSWPEVGDSARKVKAKPAGDPQNALMFAVDNGIAPDVLKALETAEEERTEELQKLALSFYQWASPELEPLSAKLAMLQAQRAAFDAEIPRVLMTERTRPRLTRVLPRGNFLDESGAVVTPAIPAFLGKLETGDREATRLDLANWIVAKNNPLTARVYVNRLWRQFFGTGLSKVLEDLGSQGEWPTHPELLDWMAAEFMQPTVNAKGAQAWDMKHLVRTVVLSHTYRQSSLSSPQLDEKDPDNRLLARQSRFRVDAEVVHDIALSVSGLLKERFGGPSVRPYQPEGYLFAMNFPKRDYSESWGDDLYRRALYTEWRRTFLHPTLQTFDAPTREECAVNRVNSNTPLQALILLNDPIFVEAARVFAQNMSTSGGATVEAQIAWAFEKALNRAPTAEEKSILTELYRKTLQRFESDKKGAEELLRVGEAPVASTANAPQLAALTTVARTILNLHETITRN